MELTNSKRLLYTASYVTTEYTPEEQKNVESKPSDAIGKAIMLRSLELQPQDLEHLQTEISSEGNIQRRNELQGILSIAKTIANRSSISMIEIAADMAPISHNTLIHFAKLADTSTNVINSKGSSPPLFFWMIEQRRTISPIGRIHLERIEMYPAGVEKGELVFSVPMAPGETVTISHKEWSITNREFVDITQDFFESYSEQGVAEKTDTAMSYESEKQHSSALNFGASLSGSYAGVTLTTTLGITDTRNERQSIKESLQKNREVTEKASARARKEHKVSMKLETKMGVEDHSGKTITNTATTPIRIDYYRMMRKWRTNLYRYGLRQTYDIAIPLPGVRLWALHERVAELDKEIRLPFSFTLKTSDINVTNWRDKAKEFGAPPEVVPFPPDAEKHTMIPDTLTDYRGHEKDRAARFFGKIDFTVPNGYTLSKAKATAKYHGWSGAFFSWGKGGNTVETIAAEEHNTISGDLKDLYGLSGGMSANYFNHDVEHAALSLELWFKVTVEAINAWKNSAWSAIKASAEARYHEEIARKQEERDKLWRLLNGKDTLTLRRLEREELMRLVMQWLFGPTHPISTSSVEAVIQQMFANEAFLARGGEFLSANNPTFRGMNFDGWSQALLRGDLVKFIHHAVEWENMLYFLYPYFWGSENLGQKKILFEHADSEHERFLRAGYARIVLPVRPGFEETFTKLLELGSLTSIQDAPYITVAQEIANFARTNYSGIPPANPEMHARPLLFPEQRTTWDIMQNLMEKIDEFKKEKDHYPTKLEELVELFPDLMIVDAWGSPFVYRMPGLGADYDLVSLGADNEVGGEGLDADISSAAGASLMATWFDYTPTSALDIEVDTKIEDLA